VSAERTDCVIEERGRHKAFGYLRKGMACCWVRAIALLTCLGDSKTRSGDAFLTRPSRTRTRVGSRECATRSSCDPILQARGVLS